jgi:hypothetical protein
MGRRSKGIISRLNNFWKLENTHRPSVEDVFDEFEDTHSNEDFLDLEHDLILLDKRNTLAEDSEDSDSDGSDDEEFGEDELQVNELQNEADIEYFGAILTRAQAMAVKAEREAAGERSKRKKHYTGNSDRTKRHHVQKRRKLEATGQKLISSMFMKKVNEPTSAAHITGANQEQPGAVIEFFDDSDLDDGDEIEVFLKELFPGQREVSAF